MHLPRHEEEEEDQEVAEDQTNEVKDVPGSLEMLSNTESKLEGHVLWDINMVGTYGESAPRQPTTSAILQRSRRLP